jgi:hypothetical protein
MLGSDEEPPGGKERGTSAGSSLLEMLTGRVDIEALRRSRL